MPAIKRIIKVAPKAATLETELDEITNLRKVLRAHPLLRPEDLKIWRKTGFQFNRIELGVRNDRKLKLKLVREVDVTNPKHVAAAIKALGKANDVVYYGGYMPALIKSGYFRIYVEEEALKALAKKLGLKRVYPPRVRSPVSRRL